MVKLPCQREGQTHPVGLLSLSPETHDHAMVRQAADNPHWTIHEASTLRSALMVLRDSRVQLVICEKDLQPGTWRDVLASISLLPNPPYLIVTSHVADDAFWVEALSAGAYNVLPKPFDLHELKRTVREAWLEWQDQFLVNAPKTLAAAV